MSVASIDYTIDQSALDDRDPQVEDLTALLEHTANLRRAFTGRYVPRHRADGPAV